MRWKLFTLWINLLVFGVLIAAVALVYIWPQRLATVRLSQAEGKIVILQLISLLLLLGGFQRNLGTNWCRALLGCAFVVLGEATLMALLLPG